MDVLIIHPSKVCVEALKGYSPNFLFSLSKSLRYIASIVLIKVDCGTASSPLKQLFYCEANFFGKAFNFSLEKGFVVRSI
jgi:hypothetical protein